MQSENEGGVKALKRFSFVFYRFNGSTLQRVYVLLAFERQHLSTAVIAARWASDVRRDAASALGTLVQMRRMPAVRCFARA
jgi:hypothetical protein